jgi:hypothetical protein
MTPSKITHLCDERLCGSGNQVGNDTDGADDSVLLETRCREWLICRQEGSVAEGFIKAIMLTDV